MNAKIYLIEVRQAYRMDEQGIRYSLTPWGEDTEYYKGEDDGGKMYNLPDGFEVAEASDGYPMIFDETGGAYQLVNSDGAPGLIGGFAEYPIILQRA